MSDIIRYEATGTTVSAVHADQTVTVEMAIDHNGTPQDIARAINTAKVNAELMNKYIDMLEEEDKK